VKKIRNIDDSSSCQSFHIEICEQPAANIIDEEMTETDYALLLKS